MHSNHEAYEHAAVVDSIINRLLEDHPISERNWQEWQIFSRTVRSSLNVLDKEIGAKKDEMIREVSKNHRERKLCNGLPGGLPCIHQQGHPGPCQNVRVMEGQ